jgi:hypothetical protein
MSGVRLTRRHRCFKSLCARSACLSRLWNQTQAFIQIIRAQMNLGQSSPKDEASGLFSNSSAVSPQERKMRAEIAQIASEGGRFASRLTRLMLEFLAFRGAGEKE